MGKDGQNQRLRLFPPVLKTHLFLRVSFIAHAQEMHPQIQILIRPGLFMQKSCPVMVVWVAIGETPLGPHYHNTIHILGL